MYAHSFSLPFNLELIKQVFPCHFISLNLYENISDFIWRIYFVLSRSNCETVPVCGFMHWYLRMNSWTPSNSFDISCTCASCSQSLKWTCLGHKCFVPALLYRLVSWRWQRNRNAAFHRLSNICSILPIAGPFSSLTQLIHVASQPTRWQADRKCAY